MPGYCTAAQVADEFNGSISFGPTSSPTDTTVGNWIDEATQLINSKVGLRYVVPITDTADLITLRTIALYLVSARVRRRLNRVGPEKETGVTYATTTDQIAMKMLNDIVSGLTLLPGSTLISAKVGISSFTSDNGVPHRFKRGVEQW